MWKVGGVFDNSTLDSVSWAVVDVADDVGVAVDAVVVDVAVAVQVSFWQKSPFFYMHNK